MQNNLIIMSKSPLIGKVKTRLAKDIGYTKSAYLYRSLLNRLIKRLQIVNQKYNNKFFNLYIAQTPIISSYSLKPFKNTEIIGQGRGNIGSRMHGLLNHFPNSRNIIIGADIPNLGEKQVIEGFHKLKSNKIIFGKSEDGGYYMVGQKVGAGAIDIFDNVRWSSTYTLSDSLRNVKDNNISHHIICDVLNDIDTVIDLKIAYKTRFFNLLSVVMK